MNAWPEGDAPASFEDITGPLVAAIRYAYDLRRVNECHDIPYAGFEIGTNMLACCLPARELLSAESILYADEEQGRDALTTLVGLCVQVGIEQGRRITVSDDKFGVMRMMMRTAYLLATRETGDPKATLAEIADFLAIYAKDD